MKRYAVAINSVEISPAGGETKQWVCLIPAGKVEGRDGRAWNNSQPESVVENFRQLGRDLPIDIEHASELKAPKGEPAPAIGWVDMIEARNGEIWGQVQWTAAGQSMIEERAYRYLSPVIMYQPTSGIISGVRSVAVTNQPNFRLPALNREEGDSPSKEDGMWKKVLTALALPESATEDEAVVKINGLQGSLTAAMNRAESPSLEKFVPRADYDAALSKATNAEQTLNTIKTEQLETAINSAIDQALNDGKITPATTDYHRAQCRQDGGLDRFTAYCAAAPVIAGASGLDNKKPEGEQKALNAQEKEVCAALGISEEDYLKSRTEA